MQEYEGETPKSSPFLTPDDPAVGRPEERNLSWRAAILLAADYTAGVDRPGYVTLMATELGQYEVPCAEIGDRFYEVSVVEGFGLTLDALNDIERHIYDGDPFVKVPADEWMLILCRVTWEPPQVDREGHTELEGYYDLDVIASQTSTEIVDGGGRHV